VLGCGSIHMCLTTEVCVEREATTGRRLRVVFNYFASTCQAPLCRCVSRFDPRPRRQRPDGRTPASSTVSPRFQQPYPFLSVPSVLRPAWMRPWLSSRHGAPTCMGACAAIADYSEELRHHLQSTTLPSFRSFNRFLRRSAKLASIAWPSMVSVTH